MKKWNPLHKNYILTCIKPSKKKKLSHKCLLWIKKKGSQLCHETHSGLTTLSIHTNCLNKTWSGKMSPYCLTKNLSIIEGLILHFNSFLTFRYLSPRGEGRRDMSSTSFSWTRLNSGLRWIHYRATFKKMSVLRNPTGWKKFAGSNLFEPVALKISQYFPLLGGHPKR